MSKVYAIFTMDSNYDPAAFRGVFANSGTALYEAAKLAAEVAVKEGYRPDFLSASVKVETVPSDQLTDDTLSYFEVVAREEGEEPMWLYAAWVLEIEMDKISC